MYSHPRYTTHLDGIGGGEGGAQAAEGLVGNDEFLDGRATIRPTLEPRHRFPCTLLALLLLLRSPLLLPLDACRGLRGRHLGVKAL